MIDQIGKSLLNCNCDVYFLIRYLDGILLSLTFINTSYMQVKNYKILKGIQGIQGINLNIVSCFYLGTLFSILFSNSNFICSDLNKACKIKGENIFSTTVKYYHCKWSQSEVNSSIYLYVYIITLIFYSLEFTNWESVIIMGKMNFSYVWENNNFYELLFNVLMCPWLIISHSSFRS